MLPFFPQKEQKFLSHYQSMKSPDDILTVKAEFLFFSPSLVQIIPPCHLQDFVPSHPVLSAVPVMYAIAVKCLCEYVLLLEHYAKAVTNCIKCGGSVFLLCFEIEFSDA